MAIVNYFDSFRKYAHDKFKGRVVHIGQLYGIHEDVWEVSLTIRIPPHEVADELEIYARIIKVIHVIAEGE